VADDVVAVYAIAAEVEGVYFPDLVPLHRQAVLVENAVAVAVAYGPYQTQDHALRHRVHLFLSCSYSHRP